MPRNEKVTRIIDGDTFMTASRKKPIRLANVNTPERGQKGYQSRKTQLSGLVNGKVVSVDVKARDVYGRAVANVRVGGRSVNAAMKKKN